MKRKILKKTLSVLLAALCFPLAGFFSGCKDANTEPVNDTVESVNNMEIPRIECVPDGGYMDTLNLEEGIGYLFKNAIPVEVQKDTDVLYIIYNEEDNSTIFSTSELSGMILNGNICNFPDFAKEWEIPSEGKPIYYQGELYITGMYLSIPPYAGGDLILTTLNER